MLRTALRTSEKVASWPLAVRYFWVLLFGYVDDHGKGKDNPLLVKADCFPLDVDISGETVDAWLWTLAESGSIVRYTVDNADYLAIPNWTTHQKPPHPTADVLPSHLEPGAIIRSLHADRVHDAGTIHEGLTPGLGWVGFDIGSGFDVGSSPAAMETGPSISDLFAKVWASWPKKVSREGSLLQFTKASAAKPFGGTTGPADLTSILVKFGHAYAAATTKNFTPALDVFLRKKKWTDELPEPDQQKPTRTQDNLSVVAHYAALEQSNDRPELTP